MSRHEKTQSGMTLVEVMSALALLGIVAVGIMSLLIASVRQNKLAEMRSIATGLASERTQEITSHPFMTSANYAEYALNEETVTNGTPKTLTTNYGGIPGHPEFQRVVTLTYDSPVTGMIRVQTTVSWVDVRQGTKSHVIVTYMHPRLEEGA